MSTLALVLAAQPAITHWSLSTVVDVLTTVLLTVLVGISGWALRTVLSYRDALEKKKEADATQFAAINASLRQIEQHLWGVDGHNGQASEVRQLKQSFRRIERYLIKMSGRVMRLEERSGLPSGDHPTFGGDDDTEDD